MFDTAGTFQGFCDMEQLTRFVIRLCDGKIPTSYQLAVMARTDALGNEYSVTVDNFKVYRAKAKKKK